MGNTVKTESYRTFEFKLYVTLLLFSSVCHAHRRKISWGELLNLASLLGDTA